MFSISLKTYTIINSRFPRNHKLFWFIARILDSTISGRFKSTSDTVCENTKPVVSFLVLGKAKNLRYVVIYLIFKWFLHLLFSSLVRPSQKIHWFY